MNEKSRLESRNEPMSDAEIVKKVRHWLDSKEAEIDNRWLKRVCWLAERHLAKPTFKECYGCSAPSTCERQQRCSIAAASEKPATKWVLASENLPPFMVPVITTDGKVVRPAYCTGKEPASWSAWAPRDHVTHWAHYPEPPQ